MTKVHFHPFHRRPEYGLTISELTIPDVFLYLLVFTIEADSK
jgi:hypothetical protein